MAEKPLLERLGNMGEAAAARLASEIVESPMLMKALGAALQAKGSLGAAGTTALGAAGVASQGDVQAVRRELRALARRVEVLEGGGGNARPAARKRTTAGKATTKPTSTAKKGSTGSRSRTS